MKFSGLKFDVHKFSVGCKYDIHSEYFNYERAVCKSVTPSKLIFLIRDGVKPDMKEIEVTPDNHFTFEKSEDPWACFNDFITKKEGIVDV
jgi:hypothetical protein